MKIGIFTSTYLPVLGGIQFEMYWLLKALDKRLENNSRDTVYLIIPKYDKQDYTPFKNIKVIELDFCLTSKTQVLKFSFVFSRLVKQYQLDLINTWMAYPDGIVCYIARCLTGTDYIVVNQGEDIAYDPAFDYGMRLSKKVGFFIRQVESKAKRVVTISRDMVEFAKSAGARPGSIELIPNGIEVEHNIPQTEIDQIKTGIQNRYKLTEGHVICLTLSGMRKIKGHHNLLLGFAEAVKTNPDLILFIGAHGHETENVTRQIEGLGITDHVHLIGFVTGAEKEAWFELADIYCNVAHFEPFGIVFVEAINKKMAVLGSLHGGGKDVFNHKESAYLVEPKNINEISDGLLWLARDEQRINVIEKASLLLPEYNIEAIADRYARIFNLA